jgi:hypothetical protein
MMWDLDTSKGLYNVGAVALALYVVLLVGLVLGIIGASWMQLLTVSAVVAALFFLAAASHSQIVDALHDINKY